MTTVVICQTKRPKVKTIRKIRKTSTPMIRAPEMLEWALRKLRLLAKRRWPLSDTSTRYFTFLLESKARRSSYESYCDYDHYGSGNCWTYLVVFIIFQNKRNFSFVSAVLLVSTTLIFFQKAFPNIAKSRVLCLRS